MKNEYKKHQIDDALIIKRCKKTQTKRNYESRKIAPLRNDPRFKR